MGSTCPIRGNIHHQCARFWSECRGCPLRERRTLAPPAHGRVFVQPRARAATCRNEALQRAWTCARARARSSQLWTSVVKCRVGLTGLVCFARTSAPSCFRHQDLFSHQDQFLKQRPCPWKPWICCSEPPAKWGCAARYIPCGRVLPRTVQLPAATHSHNAPSWARQDHLHPSRAGLARAQRPDHRVIVRLKVRSSGMECCLRPMPNKEKDA